jgi:hypothetical protein
MAEKTNRKTKLPMLLKIKHAKKQTGAKSERFGAARLAFLPDFGIFLAPHMTRSAGTTLQHAHNNRLMGKQFADTVASR